jgi:octopine/nopaline transport system substrate-binding protein
VIAALDGKTVGVQTATIHQNLVEQLIPGATAQLYDTQENLQLDLASGRVDAGLADAGAWEAFFETPEGANFQNFGPGLTGADTPILGQGVGIGMRKDATDLLAKVDQALCELKADGTIAELSTKWFGRDMTMPADPAICGS